MIDHALKQASVSMLPVASIYTEQFLPVLRQNPWVFRQLALFQRFESRLRNKNKKIAISAARALGELGLSAATFRILNIFIGYSYRFNYIFPIYWTTVII